MSNNNMSNNNESGKMSNNKIKFVKQPIYKLGSTNLSFNDRVNKNKMTKNNGINSSRSTVVSNSTTTTLKEFIDNIYNEWDKLRDDVMGVFQKKKHMMDYIHELCEEEGLRIKYEKKKTAEVKKKFQHSYGDYEFLLSGQFDIDRIVITKKPASQFTSPLLFEVNGLVLDTHTWKVLSISSVNLNHNPKLSTLKKIIDNCTIYPILDGTTVSLYWRDVVDEDGVSLGKWTLSSANSWEVNNYKWIGKNTYDEIVKRLLKNIKTFSYDNLDKTKAYIMSFRTPEFHPFNVNESICLIEVFDTITMERSTNIDVGIEYQKSLDLSDRQEVGLSLVNDIVDSNSTALKKYFQSLEMPEKYIRLGYILKFPYSVGGDHTCILMESNLMKRIRNCIYNLNNSITQTLDINNNNRKQFIVLRAFLNYNNRDVFKKLFPQYKEDFDRYERLFDRVVKRMAYNYRKSELEKKLPKNYEDEPEELSDDFNAKTIDTLVANFMSLLQGEEKVNIYDFNSTSIIEDHIIDIRNIPLVWKVLCETVKIEKK